MHNKNGGVRWTSDPWIAERAIILQILRNDHDERWSRRDLQVEIADVEPTALRDALNRLERHGVLVRCDNDYVASRCAFHIEATGMISI
jgi:DNA-binding HxlR family transcriptional regulator